jgi:two-component system chemotaxis response regulator CheB
MFYLKRQLRSSETGLIGIILTGANRDGANGMKAVHSHRGLTIAQNPGEAEYPEMPLASIRAGAAEHILLLKEIHHFLMLTNTKRNT